MKLSQLIKELSIQSIHPPKSNLNINIESLTANSEEAKKGALFVAIKGFSSDGHKYIKDVIQRGVKVVVVEKEESLSKDIIQLVVSDTREALAHLSCEFFNHPSQKIVLIGVTGTNGKTTSTYLLEAVLKEAHVKPGVIGTINYRYLGKTFEAPNTTPDSLEFQRILHHMQEEGVSHVAMEVSSHALTLKRVDGSHFNVALFTNLTQDHLDFHSDLEDYFQSKRRLFVELLPKSKKKTHSVINIDDPYGLRLYEELKNAVVSFSLKNPKADIYTKANEFSLEGITAKIHTPKGDILIQSSLLGEHNLLNILGIIGVSLALDIPLPVIQKGILSTKNISGRLEKVDAGQPFLVLVDYAHTDDALKNVGKALLKLKKNKIITVFGCGGDRDRKKRPLMAKAASQFSDTVIVTSDNPRTEDPQKIIEEILQGLEGITNYLVEPDRKKAIQKAIDMAEAKDIVLIAGKGHEDYQILGKTKIHFDDRKVAREAICLRQKKS